MAVYTRTRRPAPFWVTFLLSPFYLVFLVLAVLWLTFVWSLRLVLWFVGSLIRGCANLRSPRGVDSDGDNAAG